MIRLIPIILIAMLASSAPQQDQKDQAPVNETLQASIETSSVEQLLIMGGIETVVYNLTKPLSPHQLKYLLSSVGFEGESLRQAWAVVMKESTGRPMAHNQNSRTGDNSYGLFQINMIGSLEAARLKEYGLSNKEELFDPLTNARIAYIISEGGKNWSPWNGIGQSTVKWMQEFPN
jgi:hypothetical protein